jgi:hypothetical protein
MQVVLAGAFDPHRRDLALPQRAAARDVDNAVDLRRVAAMGAPAPAASDSPRGP